MTALWLPPEEIIRRMADGSRALNYRECSRTFVDGCRSHAFLDKYVQSFLFSRDHQIYAPGPYNHLEEDELEWIINLKREEPDERCYTCFDLRKTISEDFLCYDYEARKYLVSNDKPVSLCEGYLHSDWDEDHNFKWYDLYREDNFEETCTNATERDTMWETQLMYVDSDFDDEDSV